MKILGVIFDNKSAFGQKVTSVPGRANIRHGIMARLARSSRGRYVGGFRTARAAHQTSLSRKVLVTVGPGAHEKHP